MHAYVEADAYVEAAVRQASRTRWTARRQRNGAAPRRPKRPRVDLARDQPPVEPARIQGAGLRHAVGTGPTAASGCGEEVQEFATGAPASTRWSCLEKMVERGGWRAVEVAGERGGGAVPRSVDPLGGAQEERALRGTMVHVRQHGPTLLPSDHARQDPAALPSPMCGRTRDTRPLQCGSAACLRECGGDTFDLSGEVFIAVGYKLLLSFVYAKAAAVTPILYPTSPIT